MEANNMAAMREALEKIYELVMQIVEKTEDADVACDAWNISELCENALNATPRNCDIGTPAEQNEKFLDSENYTRDDVALSCVDNKARSQHFPTSRPN